MSVGSPAECQTLAKWLKWFLDGIEKIKDCTMKTFVTCEQEASKKRIMVNTSASAPSLAVPSWFQTAMNGSERLLFKSSKASSTSLEVELGRPVHQSKSF